MKHGLRYSPEPNDKAKFTAHYDNVYSTFAKAYDGFVKLIPLWKSCRLGMLMVKGWFLLGDLVRDIDSLLKEFRFDYTDTEIGGFGTVHLYVAQKRG